MSSPQRGGAGTQEMYWYQQQEDLYEDVGNKTNKQTPRRKGTAALAHSAALAISLWSSSYYSGIGLG